ncbi:MAG: response regulator, partial [Nitrosomonas sp.]|nr:response regulator [Nitrosomonas sp.]
TKELAELMGGEAGVESQLGVGSDFWFTARLLRGVKAVARKAAEALTLDGCNQLQALRILVVEDNELNQRVAKEFLEYNGAAVEIVQNGKEAIDILHGDQSGFDCVLMDVQMPVMDGLEATKIIRSDIKLANTVVIAMTANVDQRDRQRCFEAGMNDFIPKPIDPNILVSILLKWLKSDFVQAESSPIVDVSDTPESDTLVDLSVLAVSLGQNDPVKINKFFLLFVESTKESMEEIDVALTNADFRSIAALGHRLKSAALTVGALSFAECCKELESFKNGGDIERARKVLQHMQLLLEAIEKQLELT